MIVPPRYAIGAAVAVAALGGLWFYGERREAAGVRQCVAEFAAADRKGAEDARTTAERVLRDLADVDDPDELLRNTGGLRD